MSFKKILIALDEGASAARAADAGLDLARELGAEVAFVSVVDPAMMRVAMDSGISEAGWQAASQREAKNLLNAFAVRADMSPPPLEFVEFGKPAAKIVETAKTWPADLIVMGTHGGNAISNILLGSVAQGVLRHAPCPVMVLRAPE